MKVKFILTAALIAATFQARPFCGFFVAKAGASLYNRSSQVILVRDGDHTIVTMSNDFKGDVKDFAMVVPVPEVLKEKDIKVVEPGIFQRLDDHTAPRLAEYYDENPCYPKYEMDVVSRNLSYSAMKSVSFEAIEDKEDLGVTIEAQYQIGEYDILILSATESSGLKTWLTVNGYSIPSKAEEVLEPYIKNDMKFFVVKVNLDKKSESGFEELRPIQIAYDSPKFMLPIRLGMANAEDYQDLTIYAFTRTGRVECTNYRTIEMPTNRNIPEFVEPQFSSFYVDVFNKKFEHENKTGVFLEYAWDLSAQQPVKCDPCPTPPLTYPDFSQSGLGWITQQSGWNYSGLIFITRLHVRYDREHFPQDLRFQITPNQEKFQCRYVINHPANGDFSCDQAQAYLENLVDRRKNELQEASALAGWDVTGYSNYVLPYEKQLKIKSESNTKKNVFTPIFKSNDDMGTPWKLVLLVLAILVLQALLMLINAFTFRPQLR